MGHLRKLKSGDIIIVYTAKDKQLQEERKHLHRLFYRKPYSFNAKTVKANVELCICSTQPYQEMVAEWMEDLQGTEEALRLRVQNTLRWKATGKYMVPFWASGNPDDCRMVLADVQERIRMVHEVGKQLGVDFS